MTPPAKFLALTDKIVLPSSFAVYPTYSAFDAKSSDLLFSLAAIPSIRKRIPTLQVFSSSASFQNDLSYICDWFLPNKLSVNVGKSNLVNFNRKRSSSTLQVEVNESFLNTKDYCKYLGVLVDGNLKIWDHVRYLRFKLSRHSGVISKMTHYVPRSVLLKYDFCKVKPIVQYGILVHGCTSFTVLESILSMQRKTLRLILKANMRVYPKFLRTLKF